MEELAFSEYKQGLKLLDPVVKFDGKVTINTKDFMMKKLSSTTHNRRLLSVTHELLTRFYGLDASIFEDEYSSIYQIYVAKNTYMIYYKTCIDLQFVADLKTKIKSINYLTKQQIKSHYKEELKATTEKKYPLWLLNLARVVELPIIFQVINELGGTYVEYILSIKK